MAGNRWRFELFSFDFALGSLAIALLASYTFGSSGSDLGFAENLMLASRTNQAIAFGTGCVFALGNMLLLSAAALLGLTFSYAIVTATALVVLAAVQFSPDRASYMGVAIAAALLAIVCQSIGVSGGAETLPAVSLPTPPVRKSATSRSSRSKQPAAGMKNSSKGILVSLISGLALGAFVSPFYSSMFGSFGVGAYAGLVLFSAGMLSATLFLAFCFMNIPIQGGSIGLTDYFKGSFGRHLLGIAGGIICSVGILLLSLLFSFPADAQPNHLWIAAAALGASVLAVALGLTLWREMLLASGSVVRSLLIGALLLVVAIGTFAVAVDKAPPPAPLQQAG